MLLYKGFGPNIEDYVDVRNWDLDVILRNVCELNKLVRRIASYGVAWFLNLVFSEKTTKFEKIFVVLLIRASSSVCATAYLSKNWRRFVKTNVAKSYYTNFKILYFYQSLVRIYKTKGVKHYILNNWNQKIKI